MIYKYHFSQETITIEIDESDHDVTISVTRPFGYFMSKDMGKEY